MSPEVVRVPTRVFGPTKRSEVEAQARVGLPSPPMGRPRPEPLRGNGAGLVVAVVGCGLVGGSVGLAVRRRWPRAEVLGVDRARVRAAALRRRAIRHGLTRRELWARLPDVDVLVLATPIDAIVDDIARLPVRGGPLTLDVGSVKQPIVDAAADIDHFVGGHPMAGHERGGIAEATATLFDRRPFVLVPAARTTRADLSRARSFVTAIGARPLVLDAATHDRCVALVSHLPHLLAQCLMHEGRRLAQSLATDDLPWSLAAGSWRDATRVAASDPAMWGTIYATNRDALLPAVEGLVRTLRAAETAIRGGSTSAIPDAAALARLRTRLDRILPPVLARGPRHRA